MSDENTGSVEAADGTQFEFEWAIPDGADQSWERELAHWPRPTTPMERWIYRNGLPGLDRAWEEARLTPLFPFHRFQFVGPFLYVRRSPGPPDHVQQVIGQLVGKVREHGGVLGFWKDHGEERIRGSIDSVPQAPTLDDMSRVAESWSYGWHQTFTSMGMLFPLVAQLEALIPKSMADPGAIAQDLIAGDDNPSQGIDDDIWQLAESIRGTEAERLLAAGEPLEVFGNSTEGAAFVAAFEGFVAEHRDRAFDWSMDQPTWSERPEAVLDLVRGRLRAGSRSPSEVKQAAAKRRASLMSEVRAGLAPDQEGSLDQLLQLLRGYVIVREERAYLQMVLSGRVRRMLLELADPLVEAGRLDRRDDILFVTPDSISSGRPLQQEAEQARSDHQRHAGLEMPIWIGAEMADDEPASGTLTSTDSTIEGVAGSTGIVTGPARVVRDPFDVAELEPGEILVCQMTTPAWTPLLGMAAALVTETGNAFSHPAIAAREYGIPCVVGALGVTKRIADGQTITVDGDRGTVVLR